MPPITLRELEKQAILQALERHHGDKQAVAAELGLSLKTIYTKLASYERTGEIRPQRMPHYAAQRVAKEVAWHLAQGDVTRAKQAIDQAWREHLKAT